MRTAIDTNVLSVLWSKGGSALKAGARLGEARDAGGLVVSAPVYAELLAYPGANEAFVNRFFEDTGIVAELEFPGAVWIEAGRRFARYAKRKRGSAAEGPKRLLADFVIGSHALARADQLMTLDPKRYQRDFPDLRLATIE